jgi:hypothetical protein
LLNRTVRFADGMRASSILVEQRMSRQHASGAGPDDFPDRLTDDQIGRLAEMIADGRCEIPNDLRPADQKRLSQGVRRRLRERLLRHVARAIAQQFHREGGA